ncbi:hypothetical protein PR202_gb17160 [Eleusine coracana subsp. coracana]|uniref:PGG domain-containing protein n=1 Tax=Eleusine coracana subsp. coracana TaxID=191504 RepID=A0AAV5EZX1_ELECO|nr:hypothetical protein PR202_gb17160 [Eleusine coracana subsp. coracana]
MASEEQHSNGHASGHPPGEEQKVEQGHEDQNPGADEVDLLWKLRKYLMLLAILAAAITYQAGLAPPGGFWQDNQNGHIAGDIVLRIIYPKRYHVFFYCNTTAFGASLIVLILLLVTELSRNAIWLRALQVAMLLGLLGLMGAYAAGSCRDLRSSVYIWVLLVGIFASIFNTLVIIIMLLSDTAVDHVVKSNALRLYVLWIEPIVTKPVCVENAIGWIRNKKTEVIQKLSSFIMRGSGNLDTTMHTNLPGQDTPYVSNNRMSSTSNDKDDLQKLRTYLLLLGILAATVTYQAGLNPPGGFWTDNDGHIAGDPVLESISPRRYKAFFYCNATAFVASLVMITLLQSLPSVR